MREVLRFVTDHFSAARWLETGHFEVKVTGVPLSSDLPSQYGCKGGVALEALAAYIHNRPPRSSRDIDLVRRGAREQELDRDVAARWMPEDFARGNGVELIKDLSRYMRTAISL